MKRRALPISLPIGWFGRKEKTWDFGKLKEVRDRGW
jgi:hypothetical protein